MRNTMLACAVMILAVPIGLAHAQNAAGASAQPSQAPAAQVQPGTAQPGAEHGPMHAHGPMAWRGWMGHPPMGLPMMLHTKAAFFRFQRGGASITVKCAEDEPTQACVNAASALLDRVRQGETHP
jgi:hypothetical protein